MRGVLIKAPCERVKSVTMSQGVGAGDSGVILRINQAETEQLLSLHCSDLVSRQCKRRGGTIGTIYQQLGGAMEKLGFEIDQQMRVPRLPRGLQLEFGVGVEDGV